MANIEIDRRARARDRGDAEALRGVAARVRRVPQIETSRVVHRAGDLVVEVLGPQLEADRGATENDRAATDGER